MSVNQIAAQIKLTEMWKALNDSQYPLRVKQKSETEAECLSHLNFFGELHQLIV